ncbi:MULTISPECIES: sigma-70 family RNA polymerase sigma factor [Bacillota]|uniref:sigma-70 family RNA polymerase sigma factor n=1 Tax=Bacillota TaxID=1239 RepID=UPI0005CD7FB7|nr:MULTISPECIES: sigma-70 family RNA polymerase sigma factor [Bacillota]MCK3906032.1 sigma-70 family RNA polymerase sigma factor [Streptococcus suis]MCK3959402.1 sigma-70 family RNA polymerase sigma factor [Streptococcus suis]MCK4041932.1 sigma-70 family RNA polymerase sigma factor [Streptococcus suis]MDG3210818.1 sigma-70 family RNA polymerase sigma factor [Streptococcus suis]MDG3218399.1 sigma-70 family RNA polymerase sigma factor [Streptococcus suis]
MSDKDKYIYVRGKKITVSDEVYRAYKKELNHEAHLKRLDKKHKVFRFGDFNTSIVDIADNTVDVEKIIETKMRIEDLYRALDSLNDEERKLIEALYFDDKTLTEVAKQRDTNPMKISRLRNKILEKLRKFLDK